MRLLPRRSRRREPAGDRDVRRDPTWPAPVALLSLARDAVVAWFLGLLLVSVAPVLLGWKTTVVVSGSMAPSIQPGDVIAAAPVPQHPRSRLTAGQVVLVDEPTHAGRLLMHRLMRYDADGRMILKGDANASFDSTPVAVERLRGIPRLRIPMVGLPFVWLQQGRYIPAAAAGMLLLLTLSWHPQEAQRSAGGRHRAAGRRHRSRTTACGSALRVRLPGRRRARVRLDVLSDGVRRSLGLSATPSRTAKGAHRPSHVMRKVRSVSG